MKLISYPFLPFLPFLIITLLLSSPIPPLPILNAQSPFQPFQEDLLLQPQDYPELHHHQYYGRVFFYPNKKKFFFVVNQYSQNQLISSEKMFNSQGNLVQSIAYHYNKQNLLKKKQFLNPKNQTTQSISFKHQNQQVSNKIIKIKPHKQFSYSYSYSYNENNKLLFAFETLLKNHYSFFDQNNYLFINKKIFTYTPNQMIVEHFQKKKTSPHFTFQSAEVREYLNSSRINKIILINQNRHVIKYVQYFYDSKFRIRQLKIFKPNSSTLLWDGTFPDSFSQQFFLHHYILYSYNSRPFQPLKGFQKLLNPKPAHPTNQKNTQTFTQFRY